MRLLHLICCLAAAHLVAAAARNPIVYIPGFTGSALEVKYDFNPKAKWHGCECATPADCSTGGAWKLIWLSKEELLKPFLPACLFTKLRRTLVNGRYKSSPGVQMRPVNFGGLSGMESSATEPNLFDSLVSLQGYKRGVDLFGAPYDWRNGEAGLEQMGHYAAFKGLVERAYFRNGRRPVILLSHSMGNQVTLSFLHKQTPAWRARYLRRWVLSAPDFGGDLDSLGAFVGGRGPFDDYTNQALALTASTAGLSWLSAYPSAFGKTPILYTDAKNYTAGNLEQLFVDMKQPAVGAMYAANHNLTAYVKPLPGLEMYAVYGNDTATWTAFYTPAISTTGPVPVTPITGPGDGDVSLQSLRQSLKVVQNRSHIFEIPGLTHFNISPQDAVSKMARKALLALLQGSTAGLEQYSRAK